MMYSAMDPSQPLVPTPSKCEVYSIQTFTRTKSTAQVLYEAAEEERTLDDPVAPSSGGGLYKVLSVWDVVAYGVGSTIGAGIFAITGQGAHTAGPAIVLSFIVAAVACLFSAFSYMEFAARVPISGSAYTFTYVCVGELPAWFVGWNLTLEYAISAAVVARTWAANFVLFFDQIGATLPSWLNDIDTGNSVVSSVSLLSAVICLICMAILLVGVKESSNFNIFITVLNISIILFIIGLGSRYVDPDNWTKPSPGETTRSYCPTGINGILTGAATVFFSYIGFDAVTTLAEEVKNPKRDVPIGIISTLIISTLLYIGTSLVVTGMVPWYALNEDAPLADAFKTVGVDWAATLISGVTVTALTGNTLTSLFGQPRVFYRMAKDGLFFKPFAYVHPKTKAPLWGTVYTGVGAAIISFLIPLDSLSNMISIGTLMAFSTVCAGVVILRYERVDVAQGVAGSADQQRLLAVVAVNDREATESAPGAQAFVISPSSSSQADADEAKKTKWQKFQEFLSRMFQSPTFWLFIFLFPTIGTCSALRHLDSVSIAAPIVLGLLSLVPVFMIWRLPVAVCNLPKDGNFTCPLVPLLPMLGIFINVYLVSSLDLMSYVRVAVWTVIGMSIYLGYGIFHSTLVAKTAEYKSAVAAQEEQRREEEENQAQQITMQSN